MKPFSFRGARLLEWRRLQRDAAQREYVRASELTRATATRLADAEEQCARASREYRATLTAAVDTSTIERYRNWIDRGQRHALDCRRLHQERVRESGTAALALQRATREVKAMERLRDRARERYDDEQRRMEMKDLDQLATLQFARKARGGADRDH